MASIQLDRVEKRFGGRMVVRDLTLDIADGELLVLVGPSGSGKSTVLRLIAGLESPDNGRIRIAGEDVTDRPPQQRDLAMVFQHYALYPHMTVRENLLFGLRMRQVATAESAERVDAVARSLGIDALLDRRPAQLSGGERQRVALGRAVVREPRAFLLDEPLSNLDPRLRGSTRAELALLHRRLGTTMVYVTHDQEEAMTLGTRVAVMQGGALEQVAPPMALYTVPGNRFVGEFIGSPAMNLLTCTTSYRDGTALLECGAFTIAAPALADHLPATVVLGVRPQDIALGPPNGGGTQGRVQVVESLGSASLLHVALEGLDQPLVRVLVGDEAPVAVEAPVSLHLRRDRLHLFDSTTGARLS
jgi:multiple sugar transport system ATP-binding protein